MKISSLYTLYTLLAWLDFFSVYSMCINSADTIRQLKAAGWAEVRQKGSHVTFKHPANLQIITVPPPRKDLGKGLVRQIERISGLKLK